MYYTTDIIISKLQAYNDNKRKLKMLEFEISNGNYVSPQEMLEMMAFRSSSEKHVPVMSSTLSDKTMHIAVNYQKLAQKENAEAFREALHEWCNLRAELDRMDLYLNLLDEQLNKVLRCMYFERKTWREVEEEMGLSRRTIIRRKQEVLEALVEMYSYTQNLIKK